MRFQLVTASYGPFRSEQDDKKIKKYAQQLDTDCYLSMRCDNQVKC